MIAGARHSGQYPPDAFGDREASVYSQAMFRPPRGTPDWRTLTPKTSLQKAVLKHLHAGTPIPHAWRLYPHGRVSSQIFTAFCFDKKSSQYHIVVIACP
jgi:hypothetical protein